MSSGVTAEFRSDESGRRAGSYFAQCEVTEPAARTNTRVYASPLERTAARGSTSFAPKSK